MPQYRLTEDGTVEGRPLPKDFVVILSEKRASHHAAILELVQDSNAPSADEQPDVVEAAPDPLTTTLPQSLVQPSTRRKPRTQEPQDD